MNKNYRTANVQNIFVESNNIGSNPLNEILFNTAKIDSFTMLIPFENVDIVSSTFLQRYKKIYKDSESIVSTKHNGYPIKVYEDTGEEVEFNGYDSHVKIKNEDLKTFLRYQKVSYVINNEKKEYITIVPTSKLLLNNYFNGINKDNIKQIYDYIISDNIINISYDVFLDSLVFDIDICKDYQINLDRFKVLRTALRSNVLSEKRSALLPNNNKVESYGVQFKTRKSGTLSEPFIKWYFKTTELESKDTKEFAELHLYPYYSDSIEQGIARCEGTIKNHKHKKRLGIENVRSVNDLMNLDLNQLDQLHKSLIKEYYQRETLIVKNTEKMNRNELVVSSLIDIILDLDSKITSDELLFRVNQRIDYSLYDRNMKGRVKTDILQGVHNSSFSKQVKLNDKLNSDITNILYDVGVFISDETNDETNQK